ncbi:MAG: hypothetical protein IKI75_11965 [Lachnospiraceae bacterium]|nr:hypothetical protein [Lachnospiraceae bacterium]
MSDDFGMEQLNRKKVLDAETADALFRTNDIFLTRYGAEMQAVKGNEQAWLRSTQISSGTLFDKFMGRSLASTQAATAMELGVPAVAIEQSDEATMHEPPALTKHQKKAIALQKKAMKMENDLLRVRTARVIGMLERGDYRMTTADYQKERALLNAKLEAIDAGETAALKELSSGQYMKKLEVQIAAMKERIDAEDAFSSLLPMDSKVRSSERKNKEKMVIQLRDLKQKKDLLELKEAGKNEEYSRGNSTRKWHSLYEKVRSLFGSPDESLSCEDKAYVHPDSGELMVNRGRMTFGGTKPMYLFEEKKKDGSKKEYLYKEAVTCLGAQKPARAEVTVAASRLQRALCGDNNCVKAYIARNRDGVAIGTFQEKVQTKGDPDIDLFSWQADPKEPMSQYVANQVLREHALDWLLCNFDTKGENFLQQQDGSLVSIDKEASFSHIDDKRAEHMSHTEVLHKNDTIYNVLFTRFVEGPITGDRVQDLNFDVVLKQIEIVEKMSEDEYMGNFRTMLKTQYGPETDKKGKPNKKYREVYDKILQRKTGLRHEYEVFFAKLIRERRQKIVDSRDRAALAAFDQVYVTGKLRQENGEELYTFTPIAVQQQQQQQPAAPQQAPANTVADTQDELRLSAEQKSWVKERILSDTGVMDTVCKESRIVTRNIITSDVPDPRILYYQKSPVETVASYQLLTDAEKKKVKDNAGLVRDALDGGIALLEKNAAKIAEQWASRGDQSYSKYNGIYFDTVLSVYREKKTEVGSSGNDWDGSIRLKNAKKYKDKPESPTKEKDLKNLIDTTTMDCALKYANKQPRVYLLFPAGSVPDGIATEEVMNENLRRRMAMNYLSTYYLDPVVTEYGKMKCDGIGPDGSPGDWAGPVMREHKSLVESFTPYLQQIKNDISAFSSLGSVTAQYDAVLMTVKILEKDVQDWKDKNKGESNAYLEALLADARREAAEGIAVKNYVAALRALSISSNDDVSTEIRRNEGYGNVQNQRVKASMAPKQDDLVSISERLMELDKIEYRSEVEEQKHRDLVKRMVQVVTTDAVSGDECDLMDIVHASGTTILTAKAAQLDELVPEAELAKLKSKLESGSADLAGQTTFSGLLTKALEMIRNSVDAARTQRAKNDAARKRKAEVSREDAGAESPNKKLMMDCDMIVRMAERVAV